MRRCLIIAFSLVALPVWAGFAPRAVADEGTELPPRYQLDLIVTTAFRESQKLYYTIETLTAEDLLERDVTTVAQALNHIPGLHTKIARVGHGEYVFLRGFEQQHLLILIDDVPLYSPYDGLVELDHIPSDQIQAIKVIKGPGSAHYGFNTMGGVIHIVTKNPHGQPHRRSVVVELGENGTSYLRLHSGWLHTGPLSMYLWGSRARSDGFRLSEDFRETKVPDLPSGENLLHYENGGRRENSDYAKDAVHLLLTYLPNERFDRFRLDLSASMVDSQWGVPPHVFYNSEKNRTSIRYWRFKEWRHGMMNITATTRLRKYILAQTALFFNTYDNALDGYDDDTYSSQGKPFAFHSVYDDHALGGHFKITGPLGRAGDITLSAGAIQDVHRDTPDLGKPTDEYEMRTWWVALEDRAWLSERISAAAGLNYAVLEKRKAAELPDLGDDMSALNPQISLAYLTSPSTRIYLSLARMSRFPTMKQLYGQDGDPKLKIQKADHLELGGEWHLAQRMTLRGALFFSRVRDLIEGNYTSRTMVNIEKGRLCGGELTFKGHPSPNLEYTLGYSYIQARNESAQRPGDRLQYRPEHQLNWSLWAKLPCRFTVHFDGAILSRRYFYDDFHDRLQSHLPSYAVGNLVLRQHFSNGLEPFISISNISDTSYEYVYTSPAPGRQIRVGLRMTW